MKPWHELQEKLDRNQLNFSASPYIVHFNEAKLLQTDSRNDSHHADLPVVAWRSGVESKDIERHHAFGPSVDNTSMLQF